MYLVTPIPNGSVQHCLDLAYCQGLSCTAAQTATGNRRRHIHQPVVGNYRQLIMETHSPFSLQQIAMTAASRLPNASNFIPRPMREDFTIYKNTFQSRCQVAGKLEFNANFPLTSTEQVAFENPFLEFFYKDHGIMTVKCGGIFVHILVCSQNRSQIFHRVLVRHDSSVKVDLVDVLSYLQVFTTDIICNYHVLEYNIKCKW